MLQLVVQGMFVRNYHIQQYNILHLYIFSWQLITTYALCHLQADSLFDYYSREKPEEAWTDKSEFHWSPCPSLPCPSPVSTDAPLPLAGVLAVRAYVLSQSTLHCIYVIHLDFWFQWKTRHLCLHSETLGPKVLLSSLIYLVLVFITTHVLASACRQTQHTHTVLQLISLHTVRLAVGHQVWRSLSLSLNSFINLILNFN